MRAILDHGDAGSAGDCGQAGHVHHAAVQVSDDDGACARGEALLQGIDVHQHGAGLDLHV